MGFDCVVVDNDSTDGDGKSFNLEDFEQMEAVKGKQLSSMAELDRVTNRKICSECGRKRMYFCYDCRRYMDDIERLAPKVEVFLYVSRKLFKLIIFMPFLCFYNFFTTTFLMSQ